MKIGIERQAMQMALNALERTQSEPGSLEFEIQEEAMDALREALAAPQKQLDDISVVNMGALPARQSIPDGYVLVPTELTEEMRAAAKPCTTVSALWASIIAAAPNPAPHGITKGT